MVIKMKKKIEIQFLINGLVTLATSGDRVKVTWREYYDESKNIVRFWHHVDNPI